jgi:hypothetical protein
MSKFLTITLNLYGAAILSVAFAISAVWGAFSGESLKDVAKVLIVSSVFGALALYTQKQFKKEKDGEDTD